MHLFRVWIGTEKRIPAKITASGSLPLILQELNYKDFFF